MLSFFNDPSEIVDHMLEGVALGAPVRLLRDGHGMRLVVRQDWAKDAVAIVSGGGAGHEPAHAGFVGAGMLTAAVSGELFASPSVDAVLTAIREVTGPAGCLLVVKNYTGDRLNFGLAAERARSEGFAVATVLVADDVALPGAAQPRGLAGTVLVHKLAGHLAQRGESLERIHARVQTFADSMRTLGFALSPCHVPGRPAESRGPELGMGIHNEPGARPIAPDGAGHAMDLVLEPLLADRPATQPLVVLLNDLGGCSPQELLVLTRELCLRMGPARIARLVRPARALSSLDMHGFSVTVAPADDDLLAALDAPVDLGAWPGTVRPRPVNAVTLAPRTEDEPVTPPDAKVVALVRAVCTVLVGAQVELDALDAKVGDGDAGSTFAGGARAVLERLAQDRLPTGDHAALFRGLGTLLARAMGGSSGVLCSILFTAMGTALASGASLADALGAGLERMQHYGGAHVGDRTMLDALVPAAAALPRGIAAAAAAARSGADGTATMTHAGAGRSSYVPAAALQGTVDPGAEAVARAFAVLV